jgi:PleD family two-component response regulator
VSAATVQQRFARFNTHLAEAANAGSVSVGLAELMPGDTARELIDRADADLYQRRRERLSEG